ncbi:MAG: uroporphyrinogen-III synthase [Propylenella sp.]
MRLIVIRPEPEATRTARALIRLGHEAILSPMLDIVPDPKAPIPARAFQALVVTSSNAVRALAARADNKVARDLPLFAVGDQTALEAKRAGFRNARSAGGALADLVALLSSELSPEAGPLLYVAGEERAGDLAGELLTRGFEVATAIVYRALPAAKLAGVAEAALRADNVDGVLLFSKRSAEAFAGAVRAAGLAPLSKRVALYCLSAATAEPLSGLTAGAIAVAHEPNQISLFALIEDKVARAGKAH